MSRWRILERWREDDRTYAKAECNSCGAIRLSRLDSIGEKCFKCDVSTISYKSSTYAVWDSMRQRCNNPKASGYENYGGRGIRVCGRWNLSGGEGWLNFLNDMGEAPEGMSLDRFPNNSGDYMPENCRWATSSQ